jgi:hypothetical protein
MTRAITRFRIVKKTGTHADVFTSVGLADLLQSLFTKAVELRDDGGSFFVVLPGPLPDTLENLPHSPRYPCLRTAATSEAAPKSVAVVDITREFERVKRWSENRQRLRRERNPDPQLVTLIQQDSPIQRWWILTPMGKTKLKAIDTWNRVAEAIGRASDSDFVTQVSEGLDTLAANTPSRSTWRASSNGLFCPSQIKGFNEIKPRGTSPGSMRVDSFEEWLRYQGYWQCANVVSDADNIRVYVPIPMRIASRALGSLSLELEKQPLPGCGVRSDVLATIALARLLIQHSNEYHSRDTEPFPGLSLGVGDTPADIVSGLYVTHYAKTSSRAYGVKSISALSLPDWFPITSSEDAEDWLAILDEHHRIVRSLREDRSDEIGLLIDYRRFLEKRGEPALWALLEFMENYGPLVMRANGLEQDNRRRWMLRFTDQHFRRVLMGTSTHLVDIVNDPGFEALARAVRQATVTSQNKRARGEEVWREVRYELLHDLHRKRKVPGNAFVEVVMEFVSRYNYENARRREVQKNIRAAPANVSDEELKAFLALVDRHGPATVGALLAAYGTCKEKWEEEEDSSASESSNAEVEVVSERF